MRCITAGRHDPRWTTLIVYKNYGGGGLSGHRGGGFSNKSESSAAFRFNGNIDQRKKETRWSCAIGVVC